MADVSKIKLPDQSIVNIKDYRIPGVDTVPTSGSSNLITSGGVYKDIEDTSKVVSAALNNLNDRVVDIEEDWVTTEEYSQIEQAVRDTYTKQEIDVMIADLESGGIDNVVTEVKVGATTYSPSNGTVSLPAYPTSLPASDVSSWAKSSTKPSYTLDEVSDGSTRKLSNYLPLAGGTMSGTIKWPAETKELLSFASTDSTWKGGLKYSWSSNTTVALWSKNTKGQFVWNAGTDFSANDVDGTSTRTYDFQIGRNASNELEVLTQGKFVGNSFVKSGGTSSQFLKADGSVDSNTYALASAVPSAVTESTVSGWGFTKNAGTLTGVNFNGTAATVTNGVASIVDNRNIVSEITCISTAETITNGTNLTKAECAQNLGITTTQLDDLFARKYSMFYLSERNLLLSIAFISEEEVVFTDGNNHISTISHSSGSSSYDIFYKNNGQIVTSISQLSSDSTYPSSKCVYTELAKKQDSLVSGTNIKTVNNNSLVGSGNISVGTLTGVKVNGSNATVTSGVADIGTVITSETQLSKGTTTGSGNAVTDISVSGHQITLTKSSTFLTSETSLSKGATTGSGNAVTDISVSGHKITLTKGTTFLTSHQDISGKANLSGAAFTGAVTGTSSGNASQFRNITISSSEPTSSQGSNGDIWIVI